MSKSITARDYAALILLFGGIVFSAWIHSWVAMGLFFAGLFVGTVLAQED